MALRWLDASLAATDLTFGELDRRTARFASALAARGVAPGEVLFTFLPRCPELYVALLGGLKLRLQVAPLFSNFGADALLDRLGPAAPAVILTRRSLLRRLEPLRPRLPSLRLVVVLDEDRDEPGTIGLRQLLEGGEDRFEVAPTAPETPSLLHFTSGSTGKPKGVVHVHATLEAQRRTAREVLGLGAGDRHWCTADQAWVTGTSYGVIGPWSLGVTQVQYGGAFDAAAWLRVLAAERVAVWYTAPTALRMMMRAVEAPAEGLEALRAVFSVGEPLNPEVIAWGERVLRRTVHDTWFQTETGAIMIANRPGQPVHPGSMGRPVCGAAPAILRDDGTRASPDEPGHLALEAGFGSMFRGYLGQEAAYRSKFRDGFYLTGDMARVDAEGGYWFLGRSDDVVNTAGHLVSPFEVESALLEAPEVAEAAAVGVPDDLLFEKVAAFVALRPGLTLGPELSLKLTLLVSNRVSTLAAPQVLTQVERIPKNRSGKILRRVLRARHLGQDPGDVSTAEEEP